MVKGLQVDAPEVLWVTDTTYIRLLSSLVFQLYYPLPNLTALENVMAPLLPYLWKLNFDLKQRAKELLVGQSNSAVAMLLGGWNAS